jgi:hypothetical protein
MGAVRQPFEIASGGYLIYRTRSGVRNGWGKAYPRWRKAMKGTPGARTYTRHRFAS